MFGFKRTLALMDELKLPEEVEAKILRENALKLFPVKN